MKVLQSERGVALVTALLLTLITLAIVMALLYMITWQTKLSGAHKRYKTAIAAAGGTAEIFTKQAIPYIFSHISSTTDQYSAQFGITVADRSSNQCLQTKLNSPTAQWAAACGPDADPYVATTKFDIVFAMQGDPSNFRVFSKIVDTVPGNSDLSGFDLLDSGTGVTGISSGVAPKHMPALYRIEVQGQKEINPVEKARLSVLYAY